MSLRTSPIRIGVSKDHESVSVINRVNHVEIYTENPEAVQPFYQGVSGWRFSKFEGGPIEPSRFTGTVSAMARAILEPLCPESLRGQHCRQ